MKTPVPRRLPPLPTISDVLRTLRIKAKKHLSQNFLLENSLLHKIAHTAGVTGGSYVCEVGPGPGGITRTILHRSPERLDVVEMDRRFLPGLEILSEVNDTKMHIHQGDILKFDFDGLWPKEIAQHWHDLPPNIQVVGNLPFAVSTRLIIVWLQAMSERRGLYSYGRVPLTLVFQKEVAERIVAPLNGKQRCRLSVMCQYLADVQMKFTIKGQVFVPPPKVDAGLVKIIPREIPLIPLDFKLVEKFCRHLFHYRQKYAEKPVRTLYPPEMAQEMADELFRSTRTNPTFTSIQFSIEEIRDMCFVYDEQCRRIPGLFLYDYRRPIPLDKLETRPDCFPSKYPFAHEYSVKSSLAGNIL